MSKYNIKSFLSEISDVDVKNGIVTGYAARFNNLDSDNDIIRPGAFSETIAELGPEGKNRIYHLWQHSTYNILGKPQVLKEDEIGLYFETKIVPTALGSDALKLYEAGVLNEHSIGYRTITNQREDSYNVLLKLMLWEYSTVTWGANEYTPFLGLKQFSNTNPKTAIDYLIERLEKMESVLKTGTLTDETCRLLEIETAQIQEHIKALELKKETEPKSTDWTFLKNIHINF